MFPVAALETQWLLRTDLQCKFQWWHFAAFRNAIPNPQKILIILSINSLSVRVLNGSNKKKKNPYIFRLWQNGSPFWVTWNQVRRRKWKPQVIEPLTQASRFKCKPAQCSWAGSGGPYRFGVLPSPPVWGGSKQPNTDFSPELQTHRFTCLKASGLQTKIILKN